MINYTEKDHTADIAAGCVVFVIYDLIGVQYQENSGFKAAASSSF